MSIPGKRGGGAIVSLLFLSLAASPSSTFLEAIDAGEEVTHWQARLSQGEEGQLPYEAVIWNSYLRQLCELYYVCHKISLICIRWITISYLAQFWKIE